MGKKPARDACLLFITLMLFQSWALAGSDASFWTLQEYEALYPQQRSLRLAFERRVLAEGLLLQQHHKKVKIFVVYPGHQVSDYWRRSVQSLEARLKELGIQYQILPHYTRPGVALAQQRKILEKARRLKPDYLVFTLDINAHLPLIKAMLQHQHAPKLILQNITTPLKTLIKHPPFLYVGFDHVAGTRMLHDYYRQHFPAAKYALLYWVPGFVSEQRGDSFIHMQQATGGKLVWTEYTDASRFGARQRVQYMLNHFERPAFIYACATDLAVGALIALNQAGLAGKIAVNGWGGGAKELELIATGELEVTVMRMNDDNGVAMAEAISLDLQGKAELVPQVYSGAFKLVDKTIPAAEIERLKARAFRYSGE